MAEPAKAAAVVAGPGGWARSRRPPVIYALKPRRLEPARDDEELPVLLAATRSLLCAIAEAQTACAADDRRSSTPGVSALTAKTLAIPFEAGAPPAVNSASRRSAISSNAGGHWPTPDEFETRGDRMELLLGIDSRSRLGAALSAQREAWSARACQPAAAPASASASAR